EHRLDDLAVRRDLLDDVEGRRLGLGAGRVDLARRSIRVVPPPLARQVPDDAPEPGRERELGARLPAQGREARVLGEILREVPVRGNEVASEARHPRDVGEEHARVEAVAVFATLTTAATLATLRNRSHVSYRSLPRTGRRIQEPRVPRSREGCANPRGGPAREHHHPLPGND